MPTRSLYRRILPGLLLPALLGACSPSDSQTTVSEPGVTAPAEPMADHSGHTTDAVASTGVLPLEAGTATVTAVPPSMKETAAYVTLTNPTDSDIVLVSAASPAAGHVMLMRTETTAADGASSSGMVETPSLTVPAGGELVLASGGDHLMLMDLTGPLEEGQTVDLTVVADDGRTLDLSAEVRRP